MAVRNIKVIENAVSSVKRNEDFQIEQVKNEFQFHYDHIMSLANDILDAIDTYNFCLEKGLGSELRGYDNCFKRIGFKDNALFFKFNNWKEEGTGPYDWSIASNGVEVWISVNNETSDVPTMLKNARYYKDKISGNYVITPIIDKRGSYTCHNSKRPLSALKEFDRLLQSFLDNFWLRVENLG